MPATETRTVNVRCPYCLSEEGTVWLDLNGPGTCECRECDTVFTAEHAAAKFGEMALRWQSVASWIASAPTL